MQGRQGVISPESLHPALTRAGIGSRGRLYIEKFAERPGDFIQTDEGLWLTPKSVAVRDQTKGVLVLGELADRQRSRDMRRHADATQKLANIFSRARVTEQGCFEGGLRWNQQSTGYLLALAGIDWGSPVFDEADEVEHIHLCGTEDCMNSRHYDFEFSRPTLRERKVDLDETFYQQQPDGSIMTIWGDGLPPPDTSLAEFYRFCRKNYPYVSYKDSKMSATSMSQVRFVPRTGCWEAWQYYCKPDEGLNWQFDGYGRLYTRFKLEKIDRDTGEIQRLGRRGHWLAHRVVWAASGRPLHSGKVLNHRCGYKRCCNPLHIEQVSTRDNNAHSKRMNEAIRALRQTT